MKTNSEPEVVKLARQLDRELRESWQQVQNSVSRTAKLLYRIRNERLWQHLKPRPKSFHDYVENVTGQLVARGKLYELLAVGTLSTGPNALPEATIDRLGLKKSYLLTRLPEKERTPELIEQCRTQNLNQVKGVVHDRIAKLTAEERQRYSHGDGSVAVMLVRNLPAPIYRLIETIEGDGEYLTSIRERATTEMGRRNLLWQQVWVEFFEGHRHELQEAQQYRGTPEFPETPCAPTENANCG